MFEYNKKLIDTANRTTMHLVGLAGACNQELIDAENKIKELERQNKAFQEQYNTSGEIITSLREQVKSLQEKIDKYVWKTSS